MEPCGKKFVLAGHQNQHAGRACYPQLTTHLFPDYDRRHVRPVHPLELRAERAGESIDLSPREAAILALLHERAGRVVDRDTLLDRCWGADYFPESRTLDMQIAKLRKCIEPDAAAPTIIETVRGAGYRFRPH